MYADDTQLYTVINPCSPDCLLNLTACADAVTGWHIRNELLLNQNKTEAIITGTYQQIAKFDQSVRINVSGTTVPFSSKLRVIGVTLDSRLSFDDHVPVSFAPATIIGRCATSDILSTAKRRT